MKQSMEKAKEEIDKNTSELLDKQKYLATEVSNFNFLLY